MHLARRARLLRGVACLVVLAAAAVGTAAEPATGFKHRGFYLHEGWLFEHPFAVRSWKREDFAAMYQLLKRLGFDRVMNWPMFESIPAPLSDADAQAIRDYARTIDDAHAAGLELWLAQTANLTPPPRDSRPGRRRSSAGGGSTATSTTAMKTRPSNGGSSAAATCRRCAAGRRPT